jgi:hypothetical protein
MNFLKSTLLSLLLTATGRVYAHGMNALGPHGGYIKMPGDFHTELVETKTNFHLYLLDMKFQNPTTENSSVSITYNSSSNSTVNSSSPTVCEAVKNNFICLKPKDGMKEIKSITFSIKKKQGPPRSALYHWPLKL